MPNRRHFIKTVAGATAGIVFTGCDLLDASAAFAARLPQAPAPGGSGRKEVNVGGKRAKVIDIHAHCAVPEVAELVKDTPLASRAGGGARARTVSAGAEAHRGARRARASTCRC